MKDVLIFIDSRIAQINVRIIFIIDLIIILKVITIYETYFSFT